MTLSMYQASIPVFLKGFENLSAILDKGLAYAQTKGIDPSTLVNAKLYDDMFPLARQIQIASDGAKGGGARLAGVDIPSFEDTESTFEELQERIAKTVSFLRTLKADQIDGSEDKDIFLKIGGEERTLKGQDFLLGFVLPNFYFHISIAYAILRHHGLEIGKKDYLGLAK